MTPSVRGLQKARVAALLAGAGVASGALAGFVAGVAWQALSLPVAGPLFAASLGMAALLADAVHARTGQLRPLSVGRQVPQAWSALFSPGTVAVLYGARLGVGPLTILRTHVWWAAVLAGVMAGPAISAGTGATFAAVRAGTILGVAEWARHGMAARMARVRAAETAVTVAGTLALAGAVLTVG